MMGERECVEMTERLFQVAAVMMRKQPAERRF